MVPGKQVLMLLDNDKAEQRADLLPSGEIEWRRMKFSAPSGFVAAAIPTRAKPKPNKGNGWFKVSYLHGDTPVLLNHFRDSSMSRTPPVPAPTAQQFHQHSAASCSCWPRTTSHHGAAPEPAQARAQNRPVARPKLAGCVLSLASCFQRGQAQAMSTTCTVTAAVKNVVETTFAQQVLRLRRKPGARNAAGRGTKRAHASKHPNASQLSASASASASSAASPHNSGAGAGAGASRQWCRRRSRGEPQPRAMGGRPTCKIKACVEHTGSF